MVDQHRAFPLSSSSLPLPTCHVSHAFSLFLSSLSLSHTSVFLPCFLSVPQQKYLLGSSARGEGCRMKRGSRPDEVKLFWVTQRASVTRATDDCQNINIERMNKRETTCSTPTNAHFEISLIIIPEPVTLSLFLFRGHKSRSRCVPIHLTALCSFALGRNWDFLSPVTY